MCHSYSVKEDELGDESHGEAGRAGASWPHWGHSPTVPEQERQGGCGESNQGHPRVQIIRRIHSDKARLRSSQEVKAVGWGPVQISEVRSQAWPRQQEQSQGLELRVQLLLRGTGPCLSEHFFIQLFLSSLIQGCTAAALRLTFSSGSQTLGSPGPGVENCNGKAP